MKILNYFVFILISMTVSSLTLSAQSSSSNALISLAKSKMGSAYVYAKTGPNTFDCSGFVYYVFHKNNIPVPRTSIAQSKIGAKITRDKIKKGDLVFFDTSLKGHVNHSGIYLGNGKFIHASSGKAKSVTISDIDGWYKDKFKWGIRKKR